MSKSSVRKSKDGGFLNSIKEAFLPSDTKRIRSGRTVHARTYSVTGNGVAYRKASDYMRDDKVVDFLEEAEQVRVAR